MRAALSIAAIALVAAAPASASSGGVTAPSGGSGAVVNAPTGGVRAGDPATVRPKPRRRARRSPTLTSFAVSSRRLYAYGAPLRVSYEIDGVHGPVPAALGVFARGSLVRRVALGAVGAGSRHSYLLHGDGSLPEGPLELRISARHLRRGPHASAAQEIDSRGHAFPLVGPFTYPAGGEFGAPRSGHVHQGQDLSAALGTPIVAPRGGTITTVAYQAGGAGYYVVLRAAGEGLSYVFMHLEAGSTAVHVGQTVLTAQRIGLVGATGDASGPHLHFEVWQGPWATGGHPVDPLPYLKRWRSAT